jgi:DNA-directed RNA polymerase sigma subunit (sigma70/sigma32)
MDNREKYEQLILASPLFSLDRERDRSAYQREALKMVEILYLYKVACDKRYEEYGLEIAETANTCIENYDPQNGEFLHYFNAAMKKARIRAEAQRDMQETRGGIHIASEDDRSIRAVLKYMKKNEITHPTAEQIRCIAEALSVTEQRVCDLLRMNAESVAISDTVQNEDGEEISLFDTIASDENVEQSVISADNCRVVLESIQTAYDGCQERQKPILSAMLTAKIAEVVCQCAIPVASFTFVDKQLLTEYIQTGTLPTQRELAARFGKNEASLSRTLKEFLGKVKT